MAVNANWARWIYASLSDYLREVAIDANLPAIIESFDERTKDFQQATDRAEIRINGPFTNELSRGYYRILVDANVLVTSRYDGSKKNAHDFLTYLGLFHSAMDAVIPIFKHGLQPGDDEGVQIGCLSPTTGRNEAIRVYHFGQIVATERIKQSLVDATYEMFLSE